MIVVLQRYKVYLVTLPWRNEIFSSCMQQHPLSLFKFILFKFSCLESIVASLEISFSY